MIRILLPDGLNWEPLSKRHNRPAFDCGDADVNHWLRTGALQSQEKHLSSTKVLADATGAISAYYTLAIGEVDFKDLPADVVRRLPHRRLPVATLAWLGVDASRHGHGVGTVAFAQALAECWAASSTFPFVAVVIDCISQVAKEFFTKWDFEEVPGDPWRLFAPIERIRAIVEEH